METMVFKLFIMCSIWSDIFRRSIAIVCKAKFKEDIILSFSPNFCRTGEGQFS